MDSDKRTLYLDEFNDDKLFTVTERAIAQSSAKELLYSMRSSKGDDPVDKKIRDIITNCGLSHTEMKKSIILVSFIKKIFRGF